MSGHSVSSIRDLLEDSPQVNSGRTAAEDAVGACLPGDDTRTHPLHCEPSSWTHKPPSELRRALRETTDADEARAITRAMQLQQLHHSDGPLLRRD